MNKTKGKNEIVERGKKWTGLNGIMESRGRKRETCRRTNKNHMNKQDEIIGGIW